MAKKEKVEEVSTEQVSESVSEAQEAPAVQTLTLVELDQIAQIIDLASSRGAFRGGELQAVGSLYNKLTEFLSSVKAQQDAAMAESEAEAPAEGE